MPVQSVDLKDMNSDGRLDIVVGNIDAHSEVFMGTKSEPSRPSILSPTLLPGSDVWATTDVKFGEVNGDSLDDIVLAVDGGVNRVYLADAVGSYASAMPVGQESERSQSVDLVDVDRDGDIDAVFGNADDTATTYYNDGRGGWSDPESTRSESVRSTTAVGPTIMLTRGNPFTHGEGKDTRWGSDFGSLKDFDAPSTTGVLLADLNMDGKDDVVVTTRVGQTSKVYINPGSDDFSEVWPSSIGSQIDECTSAAVADLNFDGIPDLVLGNFGAANMVYLGVPSSPGSYVSSPARAFGDAAHLTTDVEVGDVDGDGAPDVVVTNRGQPNVVYYGDAKLPSGGYPAYGEKEHMHSMLGSESHGSTVGGVATHAMWPRLVVHTNAARVCHPLYPHSLPLSAHAMVRSCVCLRVFCLLCVRLRAVSKCLCSRSI